MKNLETRMIEIRAAEGGEDARLFVTDLAYAYMKLAQREQWSCTIEQALNRKQGYQRITMILKGKNLRKIENEAGAQRLQRVPPTERSGRVHSSTITVTVLDMDVDQSEVAKYQQRKPSDYKLEWFNGTTKAGGQHHQKNATCCRMTHLQTGLVRTAQTRSRINSKTLAQNALDADLDQRMNHTNDQAQNGLRRAQVGTGERAGVKRRTWRFQDDVVVDTVNNKSARAATVLSSGNFELLWD